MSAKTKMMLLCCGIVLPGLSAGQLSAEETNKPGAAAIDAATTQRLRELDGYWSTVSKAVNEGDFEAYQATCHPLGILVSGNKSMSQPLTAALARWKQEFMDTKSGAMKAKVEFRLSKRMGDATTAHETGIFRYESQRPGEEAKVEYVHLEALLLKENGRWQIMMEHQRGSAREEEWLALRKEN
jgi:ketosteroid isomerase-like protein